MDLHNPNNTIHILLLAIPLLQLKKNEKENKHKGQIIYIKKDIYHKHMILKKLTLHNFKSHKNTTINFNQGTTIITGENGAGKSTIFEAIQYALFKRTQNQKDLIKHNTTHMTVELTFTANGNNYKVQRKRTEKQVQSSLYKQNEQGTYIKINSNNKDTDNTIKEIINTDTELFLNATYIKQGEITKLITQTNSERKKIIAKLLKIDHLEKAWNETLPLLHNYEKRLNKLEGQIEQKIQEQQECEKLSQEENETSKELAELETIREKTQEIQEELQHQHQKLQEKKQKHLILQEKIQHTQEKIRQTEEQQEQALEDIKINTSKKARINEIKNKHCPEKLMMMQKKYDENLNSISISHHIIKETIETVNTLKETEGQCPICKTKISSNEKEKMLEEYNAKISTHKKKIQELQEQNTEYGRTINEQTALQKEMQELENQLKPDDTLHKSSEENQKRIMSLQKTIEDAHKEMKEYEEYEKQASVIEKEMVENSTELKKTIERIGVLKGKKTKINERLNHLQAEKERIIILEQEHKNMGEFIQTIKYCRESYGKNGVQEQIRAKIRPAIQKNANEYFQQFNFSYNQITLNDDYEITVHNNDGENSINMMSGGEQIALALALRLGITKTIAQDNMECLLLDEPTIHLDNLRIHEMTKLFQRIQIVPQLLIVTHEQELEQIADSIIKVRKDDGTSRIAGG